MKTPYDKLANIYTNCSGHMTKMATMPIYGEIFSKSSPEQKADDLGTCNVAFGGVDPTKIAQMMILPQPLMEPFNALSLPCRHIAWRSLIQKNVLTK